MLKAFYILPFIVCSSFSTFAATPIVMWQDLAEMNLKTGKISGKLEVLNGKKVKIPGFVVPLEDTSKNVTEFLLVPYPQACVHVPAPPPNQIVVVKMAEGVSSEIWYPVWVEGDFKISKVDHAYGQAAFSLAGLKIEKYKH